MLLRIKEEANVNWSGGSYINLFDAHPPFQIDGNFGGAAGIVELLVQSHQEFIELLPALPSALPEGLIRGVCARGGFELDMKWKDGHLEKLTVLSKAGMPCKLKYDGEEYTFDTRKGELYVWGKNF
jgi:alpha-L-fucosidase 2